MAVQSPHISGLLHTISEEGRIAEDALWVFFGIESLIKKIKHRTAQKKSRGKLRR
jgi:hypothetical protein